MAIQTFKIDVTVTPDSNIPAASLENGFAVTSLRKSLDDEKQIITCVAMVANEIDAHGDLFLPSAVEMAAHSFLANYNLEKFIGKQHDASADVDADLIGSIYTESGFELDGLEVPAFSWVVQIHVKDEPTWTEVKKAERTGVSIQGPASGWIVNQDVAKQLTAQIEKSKAGSSQFKTPLRVFETADPTNLDIVDSGANLRLLVYKQKAHMADTKELITTEAVKAAKPESDVAVIQVDGETVAKKLAPAPAEDPVDALLARMQVAKGLDLDKWEAVRDALNKALGEPKGSKPATQTEVVKSAAEALAVASPATQIDLAKSIADAIATANAPLLAQIEELRKAKLAPSAADDETAPEIAKSQFPNNRFGDTFNGIGSK